MPKNSRNKGAVAEREIAQLLQAYGFEARRGQQFAGGSDSPDVVHNLGNFHLEVKRVEAFQLYKAMEQAELDRDEKDFPVVLHRRNNRPWVAILDLRDFLTIVKGLPDDYRK